MIQPHLIRRTAEFGTLYLAFPIIFAVTVSPDYIWHALSIITVLAGMLLAFTPGFQVRNLMLALPGGALLFIAIFVILLLPVAIGLPLVLQPDAFFWIPRERPGLWLLIMLLYPLISAIPQELFFRVLFFSRYRILFPNPKLGLVANGFCFGLAHLFLWNIPAAVFSAIGGVIFAYAYHQQGSFLLACILHSLAGQLLFTTGAGVFFYHGVVG